MLDIRALAEYNEYIRKRYDAKCRHARTVKIAYGGGYTDESKNHGKQKIYHR